MTPDRLRHFENENTPFGIWKRDKPKTWHDLRSAVDTGLLRPLSGENTEGMNLIINSYVLTDAGREAAGLSPLVVVVAPVKPAKKKKQESKSLFGDEEYV